MTLGKRTLGTIVGGLLLIAPSVYAADQGITGKKLQLKDPAKVKVLSKDASISIMGSDPVRGADSSITFDDGTNSMSFSLPAMGWSANGAGTLFKYKNDAAPGGPSPISGVKIGAGKLKVSGKDLPFAVPNGIATIDVVLSLDGGTNTYCMSFPGIGNGTKFSSKDAAAGSCVAPEVCGNNTLEPTEECDGNDDAACPGLCQADCTCGNAVCGNGIRDGFEDCDGGDDSFCPGLCVAGCVCEDPCPASVSGLCFAGSATGIMGSFMINPSGAGGTITTDQGSGSFSYSYACPSPGAPCDGQGSLALIGTVNSMIGPVQFTANLCIDGSSTQSVSGSYNSAGFGGGTLSGGPCP